MKLRWRVTARKISPTKRAPDAGDCPQGVRHASSQAVFYAYSFFWLDGFAVHCPSAGILYEDDGAIRWAAPS
ncbi:MAG: hypothetical protein U0V02_19515 [Anaerolineales bacterium]